MNQLIFLGAPGSGKGTQALRLAAHANHRHISTGDLLRQEIAKGSPLGKRVQTIMNQGQLVDDATVIELLQANCEISSQAYIFDGFPRNLEQARMLDDQVLRGAPSLAVSFEMEPEPLMKRLSQRRTCNKCGSMYNLGTLPPEKEGVCDNCPGRLVQRKDDTPEVITARLEVFQSTTKPVLDYYQKQQRLVQIDASQDPEQVFQQLLKGVGDAQLAKKTPVL